jgi:hypothetical protein
VPGRDQMVAQGATVGMFESCSGCVVSCVLVGAPASAATAREPTEVTPMGRTSRCQSGRRGGSSRRCRG